MNYNPQTMIRSKHKITGSSAILLPYTDAGEIDCEGLRNHVRRTAEAGIAPAVNIGVFA